MLDCREMFGKSGGAEGMNRSLLEQELYYSYVTVMLWFILQSLSELEFSELEHRHRLMLEGYRQHKLEVCI